MKLAIISDIHDNLVNLKKCIEWINKNSVEVLICCGDVTNYDTLEFLSINFKGTIYLVYGNMEIYEARKSSNFKNINYLGRLGKVEIDGKFVGICHEPWFINKVESSGRCDVIFYGHTHKPWIEKKDGILIINPGTLGAVFQKATFAFWDTSKDEPELKILELI